VAVNGRHQVHVQRLDGNLRLPDAYANAINDSGMVGGCSGGDWDSNVPAIWRADGSVLTLDGQNRQGCVEDMNSDGAAVGWYRRAGGSIGEFLYQDGRFHDLGSLLGDTYELQAAHAINDGGQILVELVGGAPLLLTPIP
jgi:probable HAF family extracellular repeat protein